MTRSPDDIFAAQFWSWPDPGVKRDPYGRVVFVNAAFLQLFGGSVETWQGQTIQGWAAPQPGGHPNRFEIRTPAAPGYPEQVYDWIEQVGHDGSAFALARNVTAFMNAPVPAPHQQSTPLEPQADPQSSGSVQPALGLAPDSVPEPATAPTPQPAAARHDPAPVEVAPAAPVLVEDIAVAPQPAPVAAAEPAGDLLEINPHDSAPAEIQGRSQVPAQVPAQTPLSTSAPAAERDFERRALPIENEDAILGNNWRDAVIAKAVGGEEGDLPSLSRDRNAKPAVKPDAIRILLAEDNAINALLTRTLLEADGHTVETVEDGALAVEAMKTQDFDMIFMDMRMPNMDGLEATRKIRGLDNVSGELPIVALTANAFDDDRNACFDSGMNDFMTKPVSAEELSEMVVRWTSGAEQKLAS
ncbi:response regulator [uncultured Algimonas sp.]|uniref:response regulator n=1 Tax=uncultured Algimonas sp. TaxID=1547920 RepID=UPI00260DE598|nr:response regulator [uncultured Algimonas sp.]